MKTLGAVLKTGQLARKCLALLLVALAFLVVGCPHNDYLVELKPTADHLERSLTFYRQDGMDTNTGIPNYRAFDAAELAMISAWYPTQGVVSHGMRYLARGSFTNELPADVGGAGFCTNLITSLGSVGFYAERFRGNDDLAGMTERRLQAANRLADLVAGWSKQEFGREPGYAALRRFLEVEFRRDLKNLGTYYWEGELAERYKTNASEEFAVRFGQYLWERGYVKLGEIPGLIREVSENDTAALGRRIQCLVARKMGVPEGRPMPASLGLFTNVSALEKSFNRYLASTPAYRAKLKQWQAARKMEPGLERPEPSEVIQDALQEIGSFNLWSASDHLVVRLALPVPPQHSNGRWEEAQKQVVWDTDIVERTNVTHMPFCCYANWAQPADKFQLEHFGKIALAGDVLVEYCLWRSSLDQSRGQQWEAFLATLKPGPELLKTLAAFRFSGESSVPDATARPAQSSARPREWLQSALQSVSAK